MLRSFPLSQSTRTWKPQSALSAVTAMALCAVLALAGCSPSKAPEVPQKEVGIQMFQWNWNSIAKECTDSLGPAQISWVLTSPPQEHIQGNQWWTSYQPVSYSLNSKLGTEDEFKSMVSTCKEAGVDVIADAVINHMTGQDTPGTGTGGSSYQHYEYPGLYTSQDFHQCGTTGNDIGNYQNAFEVQNCELVNLADLKTETAHVQDTIANYLNTLTELGVAGFRIDAAKHMPAADIQAIVSKLEGEPKIIQEVIRGAGEPIQPEDYLEAGDVFEFSWGKDMDSLKQGSTFSSFFKAGTGSKYAPTDQSAVFVENHDTERNGSTLTYADPQYEVFTALMLANPYGTPVLYSGYAFTDHDAGAPATADGKVQDAQCVERTEAGQTYQDGDFTCQQNWPLIRNTIALRTTAGDAPVAEQWNEERDVLAFARTERGFIAVNRGDEPYSGTWKTTLPAGQYCNGGAGSVWEESCTQPDVTVADDGTVDATIGAYGALVLSVDQRK